MQLKNEMPLLGSSSELNEASEEPKEDEADKKKKKTGFRDQKVRRNYFGSISYFFCI